MTLSRRPRAVRGSTAIVTGAGAGLGRAVSLELAERGAAVACLDIDGALAASTSKEIQERGGSALGITADVSSDDDGRRAVDAVLDWREHVEILINNAAISVRKPAIQTTLDDVQRVLAVNFFGAVHLTLRVLGPMVASGNGSIVSITSVAGYVPNPLESAYGASKAALSRWSHGLRVELDGSGVDVSVVSPGPMDTAMWLQDEVPSPYSGRRYPPSYVARHVADVVRDGSVQRSVPRRFGAVGAAYPWCGPAIRWGLRRFAASDIGAANASVCSPSPTSGHAGTSDVTSPRGSPNRHG